MTTRSPHYMGIAVAFTMASWPAYPQSLGLPYPSADTRSAKADVLNGRFVTIGGLYGNLRIGCVQCHGLDGAGNSSGAFPRLADQSGWYLYKTLQDFASGLRPSAIMQPIANALTVQERKDVAAYYASIKDAPYPTKLEAHVQTLQRGGAIAAVGIPSQGVPACDGCHGARGIGNGSIYPYLAGQFSSYLQGQLILWKTGKRHGDPMNVMEQIAKAMTEDQIHSVSVYYASVRQRELTTNESRQPLTQGARREPSGVAQPLDSEAVDPRQRGNATMGPRTSSTPPPRVHSPVRPPYLSPSTPGTAPASR